MTAKEHLENFMSDPVIEELEDDYEDAITTGGDRWRNIFDALVLEISKDRKLFVTPDNMVAEYGKMRDYIEKNVDRNLFITVLFDALMVEKIKTYSLQFDAPAILSDEIHDEYLKLIEK